MEDLVGKDPEELYHLDCLKRGSRMTDAYCMYIAALCILQSMSSMIRRRPCGQNNRRQRSIREIISQSGTATVGNEAQLKADQDAYDQILSYKADSESKAD